MARLHVWLYGLKIYLVYNLILLWEVASLPGFILESCKVWFMSSSNHVQNVCLQQNLDLCSWWRCCTWWVSFEIFLVDTSLAERHLHPLSNQCRCDWLFFIQHLNIYRRERLAVKICKRSSHLRKPWDEKPYTFSGDLFKMDVKRCQTPISSAKDQQNDRQICQIQIGLNVLDYGVNTPDSSIT